MEENRRTDFTGLYKDQQILIRDINGNSRSIKMKELANILKPEKHCKENPDWVYDDVFGYEVYEDGKWVPVKKIYVKPYHNLIYKVTSNKNRTLFTAEKQEIKTKVRNYKQDYNKPADELQVGDLLYSAYENITIKKNDEYKLGQLIGIIEANKYIKNNKIYVIIENIYENVINFIKSNKMLKKCIFNDNNPDTLEIDITDQYEELKKYLPYDKKENLALEYLFGFMDGVFSTKNNYHTAYCFKTTNQDIVDVIKFAMRSVGEQTEEEIVESDNNKLRIFVKRKYYNLFDLSNTVTMRPNHPIRKDKIKYIQMFENDDEYIYDIETESGYFSTSGYVIHNYKKE